jgi:Tol biopolymer transport system component
MTRRRFLAVAAMSDPATGRKVTWFRSDRHETHHYYDISPWNPKGDRILFFRFDAQVDKLTATGRYPGSLWTMDTAGGDERQIAAGLRGNYHTGVNQFWGPEGKSAYFTGTSDRVTTEVDLETAKSRAIETPFPATRLSPDFRRVSCVRASEFGIYDVATRKYEQLVTLERAVALSPSKDLLVGSASALQNTRFSPDGRKIIIVHRTLEDFPKLVEVFVYDFESRQLRHVASNLHHPGWRPDSGAVMFVRRDTHDNFQSLWEVDLRTGRETRLSKDHVPAGHPSYHPRKRHLVVTDCYGGPMGYGLALVDTRSGEMRQLVTIPSGAKPPTAGDERFPFRNWGLWMPVRPYLNEPRPVWNADGSRLLFTSQESGRINLYVADTSDL